MLTAVFAVSLTTGPALAAPPCVRRITIALADPDGDFNGISHSGAYLTVLNRGQLACRLRGLPTVGLEDVKGGIIAAKREAPPFMHPEPVIPAVTLAPGATAKAELRWVSGDVYDGHNCATPARVTMTFDGHTVATAWPGGDICGPAGKPLPFTQSALARVTRPLPK